MSLGIMAQNDSIPIDRTVLPIKNPYQKHISTEFMDDYQGKPKLFSVEAPKEAPNVVVIMLDDNGFGTGSTFGGPIQTPVMDKFASQSILYNKFHTTSLCSPTRQALLTGRNHHTCNQASITETATSFPGSTGQIPSSVAPLAKILNYNGYSTAAYGKWHQTAVWETSASGPFYRWPTFQGFDEFYGFIAGETNQWRPNVHHNLNQVETPDDTSYHFMTDMTDQAIDWVKMQQSYTPDKPYFIYFAPGAVHAPHHVPESYIKKHKGEFDKGWDAIREETLQRQIEMGVVPKGTKLPPKPKDIQDWDDLTDTQKKLFAHQAEVFAAFLEMADYEIGRFLDALEELGDMDNTMIVYIIGDNGTSAEGGMNGLYNETTYFNQAYDLNTPEFMMQYYDEWGSPETYPHMAAGWAVAFDSPFKWTKQVASDYGGTRNGMMIKWPKGIKGDGSIRDQWHYVTDVAPTVLDVCNLPEPKVVEGVPQIPMAGVSMKYTFDGIDEPSGKHIQYFQLMGNRGLYYDGWFAGTVHIAPWANPTNKMEDDQWFLYHVEEDFNMSHDLADKYPEKLAAMQKLFLDEAVKYNVLPLDDRRFELFNAELAGRPDLMAGRTEMTMYAGFGGALENNFLNTKNRSWEIEADIVCNEATTGVILQQAGKFAGWSLYTLNGDLKFCYNFLDAHRYTTVSDTKLTPGKHTVKMTFDYDGGGYGKGGTVTLYIDGKKVGEGKVERTISMIYSGDETANVGKDTETMVTPDYTLATSHFTGEIDKVTIRLTDIPGK